MRRSLELLIGLALLTGPLFAQTSTPEIPYDAADLLKLPDHIYMGEAAGVATNSKGHIFVYTRTNSPTVTMGGSRPFVRGFARLLEFDPSGKFIREIGQGLYAFTFAHAVRVDAQDNIWIVDEGSNMVVKFDPEGHVALTLGRKPESIPIPAPQPGAAPPAREGAPSPNFGGRGVGAGVLGDNFNRPSDVAWDAAGNIFVADGFNNARVAKFDKNGKFIKTWGSKGKETGQFDVLHTIATDARGNVYVGDRQNKRIQVFDNEGNFKTQFTNVGEPVAICITPGSHQYLYSSNSNPPASMDNGEIYKMELDGTIIGKFGKPGKLVKEFGTVHEIDCRNENQLYVGEITNWRVQKLTLHPSK